MKKYSVVWDQKLKKWMVVYPDNSRLDLPSKQKAVDWVIDTASKHQPSQVTVYTKSSKVEYVRAFPGDESVVVTMDTEPPREGSEQ